MHFNVVFMCNIAIKYQYASQAVCAYTHIFQKLPGCELIGACVLIGTNRVVQLWDDQSVCR